MSDQVVATSPEGAEPGAAERNVASTGLDEVDVGSPEGSQAIQIAPEESEPHESLAEVHSSADALVESPAKEVREGIKTGATLTVADLQRELELERTRRRGVLYILVGLAALEVARFLTPIFHKSIAVFGAVFCLVYSFYGLYIYSTTESFVQLPEDGEEKGDKR